MKVMEEKLVFNINNFRNKKKLMIKKLQEAKDRGEVDTDIVPHLEILNSFPFCFTTSSCSGRIALIDAPLVGPKYESRKAYRWHSIVDPCVIKRAIEEYTPRHILWLKFDSFIISFSVSSIIWASFFIKLARYLNLKDSGIRSINPRAGYVNMDFMSTEKISVPVKTKNSVLVDETTLENIIKLALFLMKKNKIKLSLLYNVLIELRNRVSEETDTPPELRVFDPIIEEYRRKIMELRGDRIYKAYESM